ncbi:hypothetical protein EsH8_X_000271 [Colletotrichum jinshuiense]
MLLLLIHILLLVLTLTRKHIFSQRLLRAPSLPEPGLLSPPLVLPHSVLRPPPITTTTNNNNNNTTTTTAVASNSNTVRTPDSPLPPPPPPPPLPLLVPFRIFFRNMIMKQRT